VIIGKKRKNLKTPGEIRGEQPKFHTGVHTSLRDYSTQKDDRGVSGSGGEEGDQKGSFERVDHFEVFLPKKDKRGKSAKGQKEQRRMTMKGYFSGMRYLKER